MDRPVVFCMDNLESNIWKYYASGIFQSFWFILAINILYYQSFGITYTQLGLFELISSITIILFEIPTGAMADIIGRKLSVFIGVVITAMAMFVIGLSSTAVFFAAGYFIWAVGMTFVSGAFNALIYDTMKLLGRKSEYLKVQARYNFLTALSLIAGLSVAPFLFQINKRLPNIILGFAWLISSLFILSMAEKKEKHTSYDIRKHIIQMKSGINYSIKHVRVRWLFLFSILIGAPLAIFNDMMTQPYYLSVGYSVTQLGLITAAVYGSASFIASQAYKIEKRLGENASLVLIVFIQAISFFLMGLFKVPAILVIVMLLYMSRDFGTMIMDNYVNLHIPSKIRATVLSAGSMGKDIVMAGAYLLAGYLTDKMSLAPMLILFGIFVAVSAVFLFSIRK